MGRNLSNAGTPGIHIKWWERHHLSLIIWMHIFLHFLKWGKMVTNCHIKTTYKFVKLFFLGTHPYNLLCDSSLHYEKIFIVKAVSSLDKWGLISHLWNRHLIFSSGVLCFVPVLIAVSWQIDSFIKVRY